MNLALHSWLVRIIEPQSSRRHVRHYPVCLLFARPRSPHFYLAVALARLGRFVEARPEAQAGKNLSRSTTTL